LNWAHQRSPPLLLLLLLTWALSEGRSRQVDLGVGQAQGGVLGAGGFVTLQTSVAEYADHRHAD
jgi:hypothetical protein